MHYTTLHYSHTVLGSGISGPIWGSVQPAVRRWSSTEVGEREGEESVSLCMEWGVVVWEVGGVGGGGGGEEEGNYTQGSVTEVILMAIYLYITIYFGNTRHTKYLYIKIYN